MTIAQIHTLLKRHQSVIDALEEKHVGLVLTEPVYLACIASVGFTQHCGVHQMTVLGDLLKEAVQIECPEDATIEELCMILHTSSEACPMICQTKHVTYPASTQIHEIGWESRSDIVGDFKSNVEFAVVINKHTEYTNVNRILHLCSIHSWKSIRFLTSPAEGDITLSWKEYYYSQDLRRRIMSHMNTPTNITDGVLLYRMGMASTNPIMESMGYYTEKDAQTMDINLVKCLLECNRGMIESGESAGLTEPVYLACIARCPEFAAS